MAAALGSRDGQSSSTCLAMVHEGNNLGEFQCLVHQLPELIRVRRDNIDLVGHITAIR